MSLPKFILVQISMLLFMESIFAYAPVPGSVIRFPQDEGTHHTIKGLEWWYVVVHATGKVTGDRYSILVSHFNNQARFFNVTNITQKTHVTGSTFGYLKSKEGYLDLTHHTPHGTDFLRNSRQEDGTLIPFHYEMQTHYKGLKLNAKLFSLKPPMLVGGSGYGPVGSSGNTWYYSLTRMPLQGELEYLGITEPIEGLAWMDHQWGPFIVSPIQFGKFFESYEWFSIQLDNGYELMLSNIYNKNNELPDGPAYGDLQLFDPKGISSISTSSRFTRTRYWKDPLSQKYFSMGWTLEDPNWGMNLTLTPEFENQMVSFPMNGDFWEGSIKVTGTLFGLPVSGKSFGELVHYFKEPKIDFIRLKKEYDLSKPFTLEWKLKNPDAGCPIKYTVFAILENQTEIMIGSSSLAQIEIDLSLFKKITQTAPNFVKFKVRGCSIDNVICGETISPLVNSSI